MIDLSKLPAPQVVESLDFETIFEDRKAAAIALEPTLASALGYESEPATVLLQESAYRELTMRQRINEATQALMLAYATSNDLDVIGGNYGIPRLLITAGNPTAVPPVPATMEADADFRPRILQSLEGYTTAGSSASYIFHAKSASGDVLDASVTSPAPCQVTVYVLSRSGDGTASSELIAAVADALNADTVRPMTDQVTVLSASVINYDVDANLILPAGPDSATILAAAQSALSEYTESTRRLGIGASLSGIYRALHQPGVTRVELASPTADIDVAIGQAARCASVTLTTTSG
jgi:phage-related baseplate assembly protein